MHQHAQRRPGWGRTASNNSLDHIPVEAADVQSNHFLRLCKALNVLTSFAGLGLVLANGMLLAQRAGGFEVLLRIYAVGLGVVVTITEREWPSFFLVFGFLESWVGRGLFLGFNGVLAMAYAHDRAATELLRYVAGLYTLAMGVVYLALGVLCFRQLKIRQLTRIRRKKHMTAQVQQLHAHRSEIDKLLETTQLQMQKL